MLSSSRVENVAIHEINANDATASLHCCCGSHCRHFVSRIHLRRDNNVVGLFHHLVLLMMMMMTLLAFESVCGSRQRTFSLFPSVVTKNSRRHMFHRLQVSNT